MAPALVTIAGIDGHGLGPGGHDHQALGHHRPGVECTASATLARHTSAKRCTLRLSIWSSVE